jgi:hypothetical protein
MASIACLKQTSAGVWQYHFVLVNQNDCFLTEDQAVAQATGDLNAGFNRRAHAESNEALALYLKGRGYMNVTDFKIIPQE